MPTSLQLNHSGDGGPAPRVLCDGGLDFQLVLSQSLLPNRPTREIPGSLFGILILEESSPRLPAEKRLEQADPGTSRPGSGVLPPNPTLPPHAKFCAAVFGTPSLLFPPFLSWAGPTAEAERACLQLSQASSGSEHWVSFRSSFCKIFRISSISLELLPRHS